MTTRDIAELGIVIDASQVGSADAALDRLNRTGRNTEGVMGAVARAAKLAAAAFAAIKLAKLVEESALLNARFETMGVVMRVAGNNAGYTGVQMATFEKELQKTGISAIKARENLTSLATANIDLKKSTELARAAQDLAVVGNINSSEAFSRLVQGIKSGEVETLRTLGLNVNFENSYKKLAAQLGTTSDKLTDQQKIMARTNATLKESTNYAGIYEEALGTAGKQLNSLSRYLEDAKVKFGEVFNETLSFAVLTVTDALKAANKELDEMAAAGSTGNAGHMLSVGFQEAFKAVVVFGAEVLFVLTTLGRELGGFGAVLAQLFVAPLRAVNGLGAALDLALSGDFKGAADRAGQAFGELGNGARNVAAIWRDLDAQGETSRAALDKFTAKVMESSAATKELTQEQIDAAKRREAQLIAAGNLARQAQADEAKLMAQREADAKQQKKYDETYKSAIKAIGERTAALALDMATEGKLTEGQQFAIKILDDLRTGELKLTAAKKIKLAADLEAYLLQERLNKAAEDDARLQAAQQDKLDKETDAIFDKVRAMQAELEQYGLSETAILRLNRAKLEARLSTPELSAAETAAIEAQIAGTEKLLALTTELTQKQERTKFWEGLESTAHQTFTSIANGGKDAATRLKESFKNIFFDWLYQMTLKKWIISVGAQFGASGGIFGDAASAAGGGSGSSLASAFSSASSLYSTGKMIWNGFNTGLTGTVSALGTSFGNIIGSNAVSSFSTGLALTAEQASTAAAAYTAAAAEATAAGNAAAASSYTATASGLTGGASSAGAIPIIGWIIAGMAAADGFYKQGFDPNNGSTNLNGIISGLPAVASNKLLTGLGMGGSLANILSGASINTKLFGRANPVVESQGIKGTASASGVDGTAYQNILERGGWFRSSKRYTNSSPVTGDTDAAFDETMTSLVSAVKGFGSAMGIETTKIDSYTKVFDLALSGDTEANTAAITKLFGDIANELATTLIPNLSTFLQKDEAASAGLERLANNFVTVNAALDAMGVKSSAVFGAVGLASLEARERLIALAGGLDKFTSQTEFFVQNFLSQSEQLAPVQKALADQLAALGYSQLKTADDYKNAVLELANSGKLATASGAATYASLLALGPMFKSVTEAAAQAAATLAAAAAEVTQKLRDRATAALAALSDAVDAQKDIVTAAYNEQTKALDEQIAAANDAISKNSALSSILRGALNTLSGFGDAQVNRRTAQGQLSAALASARAGGELPSQDSLNQILGVLTQDSSSMFSNSVDYARDLARTSSDIESLAGIAEGRLSDAQRQLQATLDLKDLAEKQYDAEMSRLDSLLSVEQASLDALLGVQSAVLSIPAALAAVVAANGQVAADPATGITAAYQKYLDRAPEAEGLAFWLQAIKDGQSIEQVTAGIANSQEAHDVQGFVNGGRHEGGWRVVGGNGPEMEYTGRSGIVSNNQANKMLDQSQVAVEVAQLREVVSQLAAGLLTNTQRTARTLEKFDFDGLPPTRVV